MTVDPPPGCARSFALPPTLRDRSPQVGEGLVPSADGFRSAPTRTSGRAAFQYFSSFFIFDISLSFPKSIQSTSRYARRAMFQSIFVSLTIILETYRFDHTHRFFPVPTGDVRGPMSERRRCGRSFSAGGPKVLPPPYFHVPHPFGRPPPPAPRPSRHVYAHAAAREC